VKTDEKKGNLASAVQGEGKRLNPRRKKKLKLSRTRKRGELWGGKIKKSEAWRRKKN